MTLVRWIRPSVGSAFNARLAHRTNGTCARCKPAHAVLDGVRAGVVAAHLHDDFAIAADHGRRHGVAVGLASLDRSLRNGGCDRSAQVLWLSSCALTVGARAEQRHT